MTVLEFTTNTRFVYRIIKHYTTNPSRQWGNTYEAVSNASGDLTALQVLGSALVTFETNLHNTYTKFDRLIISTWEPDSKPYNPASFFTEELAVSGTRDTVGELEPITCCLSIVRQPTSGRLGHLFYRGVLSQGDTEAPAGITQLASVGSIRALLDDAVEAADLDSYMGTTTSGPLSLAMVNKSGTQTRLVMDLKVGGVVQLPVDHAWFNRTSP